MTAQQLVMQILAGGLLGMVGQGVRSIAGMKKIRDAAAASGQSFGDIFEGSQLASSLLIGFVAGALALFSMDGADTMSKLDRATMLTIMGAGYSGTDFLEALMSKAAPEQAKVVAADRPSAFG